MKIVIITGSPHKKGTSALLADEFIKGATEVGHEVFRFDSAFEDVKPCLGCNNCRINGVCVRKDSMEKLNEKLIAADAIVFAMPVYYFGMPAQIKAVVDRLYFPESKMFGNKKTALLATAYNPNEKVMGALIKQYEMIVEYMKWENKDMILACGCGMRDDIEKSEYPKMAYNLGREI